ncbi:hypothetical protein L7F22_016785 [Adiantum nelumboides]|nr:hypothetical protein [Adiantum nelumboides]
MSQLEACKVEEELNVKEIVVSRKDMSGSKCMEKVHANQIPLGEASEIKMQNGDICAGPTDKFGIADGFGTYLWSDGCLYEGDWVCGKATGRGKISWPSGTTYEGEFLAGNLHGVGTLERYGNTIYKGSWVMNVEHGLGRKLYSNGDIYEGLLKRGVQDGLGRYVWKDGNMYYGNWKRGNMCGQGSLTWQSRESYNGQWLDGLPYGHGTFIWADSSAYDGFWTRGKKDGKGIFHPPGSFHLHTLRPNNITTHDLTHVRKLSMFLLRQRFGRRTRSVKKSGNGRFSEKKSMLVLEREYAQGVLIGELAYDNLKSSLSRSGKLWPKDSEKQPKKAGEKIVKGHRSYDLMLNLQLGIRYSVGRVKQECSSELHHLDFSPRAREEINFPRKGSKTTPPHQSKDFKWTDYCPRVFRKIRSIFQISEVDYLLSLSENEGLRELCSPGKSGSAFFLSNDARYMIKTLRTFEVEVLLKMLLSYYDHLCKNAETSIVKFFGLHQVIPDGGKKIQVVTMGNIFCTELRIHRMFDLKGSLQGRSSKNIELDETTILKDQDLDFNFLLEPSWRLAFFEQLRKDCQFLESQNIMDYSLLLGVHVTAPTVSELSMSSFEETSLTAEQRDVQIKEETSLPSNLALVAHNKKGTTPSPHVRGNPLKVENVGHEEVDVMILATNSRLPVQLGVNMPAIAVCRQPRAPAPNQSDTEVYDVIIYVGIIDIFQSYGLQKRLEHVYKSLKYGLESISAVNPHLYADRLQEFIHRFFPPRL